VPIMSIRTSLLPLRGQCPRNRYPGGLVSCGPCHVPGRKSLQARLKAFRHHFNGN
jgi:hypothetical protein